MRVFVTGVLALRVAAPTTFAGLPPGHYRVSWWHPDAPGGTADVDVPAEGAVTLDVGL